MNAVQRQTLLNLTENLFESIDELGGDIIADRDPSKVRTEFDVLRETLDRYIPPSRLAGIASEMPLEQRQVLTWKHRRGTRIRLDCPEKAEHGSVGTVIEILVYNGPAILDYWEYRVEWESGYLSPGSGLCPERWAVEVPKDHGGAELAIEPEKFPDAATLQIGRASCRERV